MPGIIIPDKPYRFGKTRSEQEANLRKEGMRTLSDEQLDKCRFLEKKSGITKSFFDQREIDSIK